PYLCKCVIAPKKGRCTSEFLVLKANSEILHYEFLRNLMLSNDYIENINSSTYGAKMPRASWDFIGNEKITLQSFKEQVQISEEVSRSINDINELKSDITVQIQKLQEYRESLIYEAVTGKIDLRDININETEESVAEYEEVAEGNESYQ